MSRYLQLDSPENVEVYLELAGLGSRGLAAIIDLAVQGALLLASLLVGVFLVGGSFAALGEFGESASLWVMALLLLAIFLLFFGYHCFFELRWAGKTPGKRALGLRVVRDGGYPIDFYSSFIRNLVRIVDMLVPPLYCTAILSLFLTSDYRRLGDIAAGTLVIRERSSRSMLSLGADAGSSARVAEFAAQVHRVERLSHEEFQALRRFAERRRELEIPVQAHLAMRLAQPIEERLELQIPISIQWHYADLIEAIVHRYAEEHGVLL